jgi:hypothetical protein
VAEVPDPILLSLLHMAIQEHKIQVVAVVLVLVEPEVQKEVVEVPVVPVLSSSHTLHKYSKNRKWA